MRLICRPVDVGGNTPKQVGCESGGTHQSRLRADSRNAETGARTALSARAGQDARYVFSVGSRGSGSGTGVSPVCRLHDSHGRDARALEFGRITVMNRATADFGPLCFFAANCFFSVDSNSVGSDKVCDKVSGKGTEAGPQRIQNVQTPERRHGCPRSNLEAVPRQLGSIG